MERFSRSIDRLFRRQEPKRAFRKTSCCCIARDMIMALGFSCVLGIWLR